MQLGFHVGPQRSGAGISLKLLTICGISSLTELPWGKGREGEGEERKSVTYFLASDPYFPLVWLRLNSPYGSGGNGLSLFPPHPVFL